VTITYIQIPSTKVVHAMTDGRVPHCGRPAIDRAGIFHRQVSEPTIRAIAEKRGLTLCPTCFTQEEAT
jgi:hypothetical protein